MSHDATSIVVWSIIISPSGIITIPRSIDQPSGGRESLTLGVNVPLKLSAGADEVIE
jgi:hypothetical protein